jgi:C-methyltransferase C-terminal domain
VAEETDANSGEADRCPLVTLAGHRHFADAVARVKRDLVTFLARAAAEGRMVVGYGAPGKGNTLLNHCGIRSDLLPLTVDRSPHKQGLFLPGTHIPILAPDAIEERRPDFVLLLPWNLRAEISPQLSYVRGWGGRLVVPIPSLEIF